MLSRFLSVFVFKFYISWLSWLSSKKGGNNPTCASLLKIYNFRNIVHFLKRTLQVVDNAVFWQNVLLYFENDPLSPSWHIFYCGHVTYQIWAWFETFKGNVNRTNMANFDAHWTSGAKKRRFWDFLSDRLVVKFLPPRYFVLSHITSWNNFTAVKINKAVAKRTWKVSEIRYVVLNE